MIEENQTTITGACSALEISRDSYYKWKNRTSEGDDCLTKEIQGIALEFPFYGYRRITKELQRREIGINHKKVLKIMRKNGLLCRRKKQFKPVTTQSNHDLKIYPNLIENIEVTGLNRVWVSDITYIRLPHEFIYLAAVEDIFSRKCVGWALSREINTLLALRALTMAISKRKVFGFVNLIHHSDRGVQYASNEYVEMLQSYGIKISMSRRGNPYENAFAESFNKTLKVEEVYIKEYETFEDALRNIKNFIEKVYNEKRLHSGIGYKSPNKFEQEILSINLT